jgi:hypothetical protein
MSGTVTPLPERGMSPAAARDLTDALKRDAETLWARLLEAYERGVHVALGYPSWSAYCKTEFGTSKARSYQLLDAGRIAKAIQSQSTNVDPPNEAVVRELVPVLKQEGETAVAEAWAEVVEEHGPEPTAAQTRATVEANNTTPEKKLTRQQREFQRAMNALEIGAEYVTTVLTSHGKTEERDRIQALLAVDDELWNQWAEQARVIYGAGSQLRRYFLREGGRRP